MPETTPVELKERGSNNAIVLARLQAYAHAAERDLAKAQNLPEPLLARRIILVALLWAYHDGVFLNQHIDPMAILRTAEETNRAAQLALGNHKTFRIKTTGDPIP